MSGWIVLVSILVLLLLSLLILPLNFMASGFLNPQEQQLDVKLAWAWGFLAAAIGISGKKTTSVRLHFAGITLPAPRKKTKTIMAEKKKKSRMKKEKHRFDFQVIKMVLSRKLLIVFIKFLKRLLRSLRLRLQLSGVFGTDDPAFTGLIIGIIEALPMEHINLELAADFSGPTLDVVGETSARLIPIVVLWYTIGCFLAEPVRKIWWPLFKIKLFHKKSKEVAHCV